MPKTLVLSIKKKWFDLIKSGEKPEEYRDNSAYWAKRLAYSWDVCNGVNFDNLKEKWAFKDFDFIEFRNGYGKKVPSFKVECLGIEIGKPKKEWGGELFDVNCIIIKLGKIIN